VAKRPLGINVYDAAQKRISWAFDTFPRLYVSFSGGKDSTVMLHLVMDEAIRRDRTVGVLFLDWECQFTLTINHVRHMYELYREYIEPYWVAVPIRTWNGCSQFEPEWIAWDPTKRDLWVREPDPMSITDPSVFPFYTPNMMFEEFMPAFAKWYAGGKLTGGFLGIRTAESLNRYRSIAMMDKTTFEGRTWTTWLGETSWNIYPIYDWQTEDDWTYCARYHRPYNQLYDRMYQAGMTIHQMRIDEPFGDTQRQGLWLYHIVEPEMWAKMTARVAGANTGALYAQEQGNVLGNRTIELPASHTWESYAMFLLETMPPKTAEHYKNKIAVYLKWYYDRGYPNGIPDCLPGDTGGKDMPSWRRICKTLLRNDYWCKSLCFSPTKSEAYERYLKVMKRRRARWGLI
jgi:predicted phosphoadenosine phosphosulfate sulfurtransferase